MSTPQEPVPVLFCAEYVDMDGCDRSVSGTRKDCIACVEHSYAQGARLFRSANGQPRQQTGIFDGQNWFWTVLRDPNKVRAKRPVRVEVKARVPHGYKPDMIVTVEGDNGLLTIREKGRRTGETFDIGNLYTTRVLRKARVNA